MKKILFLLLLSVAMYGQVPADATPLENIQITNNQTSTTATKVNVQETDGTINTISKSDLVNVVEVNDVPSLPLVGEVGKIYVVKNLNKIYRWNGAFYHELASSDLNYQSIIDALTFTPENVANKATTLTASSTLYPNNDAVIAGLATKEDKANKVTSIGSSANDTNYPSELAVKTYADNLVVGMLNDRGTWNASVNVFPTTGGSGIGGAIRKGDMWYISVAGTLGAKLVNVGDSFRALVNNPAQVAANWSILEANIGYVPANDANVVHLTGAETITGVKTFSSTLTTSTNIASSTTNMVLSDNTGAIFRGVRASAWADVLSSRFFQVGNADDNGVFTASSGSIFNRLLFTSLKTQFSSASFGATIVPRGVFEVTNGTNRFFNVFESGNSVFGGSTDDLTNRLQVTGTISSGTTALGNTPPTANNQLTRKDYVDTGLNSKEPLFTKNTAFNKDFGTTAGTVAQGNDSRLSDSRTPTAGSVNYIQNQNATSQSANIRISGKANFGDSFSSNIWPSYTSHLQVGQMIYQDYSTLPQGTLAFNNYYNGISNVYLNTGGAASIGWTNSGDMIFKTYQSGSSGSVVTGGSALTLANTGAATFSSTVTAPTFVGNLTGSASQFGGNTYGGSYSSGGINGFIVNNATNGTFQYATIAQSQTALGLGSNAYTSTAYLPLSGGTLSGNLTATAFFQSSDRRLKTILKRDGDVAYFKWKDGRDDKVHIGVIAQEVRKTNPDQVQKGEDGMLSVNYVEILVEKIRVLEKRIEQLEKSK